MGTCSNDKLEDGYNFLVSTLNRAHMVMDNAEKIIEGAKSGLATISVEGIDGEGQLTPKQAEEIISDAENIIARLSESMEQIKEEIAKRSLKVNQMTNGKYYFMEQKVAKMNKTTRYSSRNTDRFIRANRVVIASDPIDILERTMSMSEADREEYITNFVKEHGLKEVFNIVKGAITGITNEKEPVTARVHDQGYKQNKKKSDIIPKEEQESTPTTKEQSLPMKSRLKTVLEKLGDWSILLTFFLMWAAISNSDYHSLVVKQTDVHAEIKAFLITSGAAFMAWAFKYLRSLLK